jgi:ABC-type amino acid transport substrate-binding protein
MTKLVKAFTLMACLAASTLFAPIVSAGDALQRIIDFKVLKVGMSANQPPMTMLNRDGNLMGFDVDLATALASAMNVQLDIKVMPFGELLAALEDDKIDMILSGMSITPERTEYVSFVGPYMMSGKSILTKNSTLGKVTQADEFNRGNLKILALRNSTSASFIRETAPDAKLIEVASYDEGTAKLIADEADAMVADMPWCVLSVLRYPEAGLTTLERPLTVEPIGIALSKDDPQFINLVENYLDAYEKTGVLTKIRKKWFEDSSWVAALP